MARELTPEEIAAIEGIKERTREALRALQAIPASERARWSQTRPESDRFFGQVGLPLDLDPDPGPEPAAAPPPDDEST